MLLSQSRYSTIFLLVKTKTIDYEQSELLLYQNMVYNEAGFYEKSIKHLEENQKYILDKLTLEEMRADSSLKGNQMAKAITIYEDLIERNPDNIAYYKKLEECLNLSKNFKSYFSEYKKNWRNSNSCTSASYFKYKSCL